MAFYLDLLLDVNDLTTVLPSTISVAEYEVGAVCIALPKTFEEYTDLIRLESNIVAPQFDGRKTLVVIPVHDTDLSDTVIFQPNIQYRSVCDNTVHQISFTLKTVKDTLVEIKSGQVLIVLHFRPKTDKESMRK